MLGFALVAAFFLAVLFGGRQSTTAILMPDDDGKVGAIIVEATGSVRTVDQAYHAVTTTEGPSGLSEILALDEAQVKRENIALLAAQPGRSYSFSLYFRSDSTELTEESQALIPEIVARVKAQGPTEITIIGHTDTTGSEERNIALGLERANAVRQVMQSSTPALGSIGVKSLGSRDPLVPTGRNVDEPRNRRVEVFVL